jgi:hypothetical protein
MDNYKPVTISIFVFFLKHDKNMILSFIEDMNEKPLGFGCMHENKIFIYFLKIKFIFGILEKNQIFFILSPCLIV